MGSSARAVWLSALFLLACVPPSQRFERLAERDPAAAVAASDGWLGRHDEDHAQYEGVLSAQAAAGFALAEAEDTVTTWRAYRTRWPWPSDLAGRAAEREASASFRDVAQVEDTAAAYRNFRRAYPDAREVPEARSREVKAALADAIAGDGVEPLVAFRRLYGSWTEAKASLDQALEVEMARALDRAKGVGTNVAFRAFLAAYGDAPVGDAILAEAHALADSALAREAIDALLDSDWTEESLSSWIAREASLPGLSEAAETRASEIMRRTEEADIAGGWWVAARLLANHAEGAGLAAHARDAAWALAATPAGALTFAVRFPLDPRAWDAEGRWIDWRDRGRSRERQAQVQRRRPLSGGEIELTLDVVDCKGDRLAGLTPGSFELWDGDTRVPISAFTSLEQERPLDVTVAVDLSGSMATERAAVDAAVERFVETLRFRNRSVRVGLVGFSDGVMTDLAPGTRTADFRGALQKMPGNLGGGAEDTTAGLLAGVRQLKRGRGERVIVLLSDEKLQINLHGRQELNLEETACDQARSLSGCVASCRDDSDCWTGCVTHGPERFSSRAARCRAGDLRCQLGVVGEGNREAQRCQQIDDHPELGDLLAQQLGGADVRLYALATQAGMAGYPALAAATGGRVIEVPNDAASSAPYEAALLDIADQLSKQYVVTYRPLSSAPPVALVNADWRWVEEPAPADAAPGVSQLRVEDAYPARLRVESDGSVSRSLDEQSWRQVLPPDPSRTRLVTTDLGASLVCTSGNTGTWCSRDLGRTWLSIPDPGQGVADLSTSAAGIHLRRGDRTFRLLRVLSRDLPASSLYFNTNSDEFQASLEPFLASLGRSLLARPDLHLRVEGHADARGSDAYNEELALRRAARVGAAIERLGVSAGQIEVVSMGERAPVRLGNTQADYQRNRRVEMILLETPDAAKGCR